MSLRLETTLAGYGRAAVDLKTRMWEVSQTSTARSYLKILAEEVFEHVLGNDPRNDPRSLSAEDGRLLDSLVGMTSAAWRVGEPYVLAPAMTAVVAAAADALNLTGERLPGDIAPTAHGVLFLPQPVYHRLPSGAVTGIGAITWARLTTTRGRPAWAVFGWSDRDDPHSPAAADVRARLAGHPQLASQLGPYLLTDFDLIPIGEPLDPAPQRPATNTSSVDPTATHSASDEQDRDWQPGSDGLYCIDHSTTAPHTPVLTALAYAFWRIQAQPLAATARPPLDRAATRRAARASVVHGTRIVMLRRLHATDLDTSATGEARWHYTVRFVVRGHWRHLRDRDGNPYRIWINAHINTVDRTTGVPSQRLTGRPRRSSPEESLGRTPWPRTRSSRSCGTSPGWWSPGSVASAPPATAPFRGRSSTERVPRSGR